MATIGVLHPGEMGAAVAGALAGRGRRVVWASAGRSSETRERAASRGLADVGTVEALAAESDVVLSVCPPHAAQAVARAAAGCTGLYVDANAISPATAQSVAAIVEEAGATYVDGGIIGLPPRSSGETRLYLSGPAAPRVAELFAGTVLDTEVLSADPTAASALKMTYAAWTKGTAALILAIRAAARQLGVEEALVSEWQRSQDELPALSLRAAGVSAGKAWRWAGEMEEIAGTFAGAGLPAGFHLAAAEVFARLPRGLQPGEPDLLERLLDGLLSARS